MILVFSLSKTCFSTSYENLPVSHKRPLMGQLPGGLRNDWWKTIMKLWRNTLTFPKCRFSNSSGFWTFRSISVPMQGTNAKKIYQMSRYRNELPKGALMRKIHRIVPEWKVFDSGKMVHLAVVDFSLPSVFPRNKNQKMLESNVLL